MGAECSCKITPSKGICTWLAMGFPGTTTLPDNKSRFLANFAKGSNEIIGAETKRTQCNSKPLEFEGHGGRLEAKKLIFLLVFLRVPSWSFVPLRGLRANISYHW